MEQLILGKVPPISYKYTNKSLIIILNYYFNLSNNNIIHVKFRINLLKQISIRNKFQEYLYYFVITVTIIQQIYSLKFFILIFFSIQSIKHLVSIYIHLLLNIHIYSKMNHVLCIYEKVIRNVCSNSKCGTRTVQRPHGQKAQRSSSTAVLSLIAYIHPKQQFKLMSFNIYDTGDDNRYGIGEISSKTSSFMCHFWLI